MNRIISRLTDSLQRTKSEIHDHLSGGTSSSEFCTCDRLMADIIELEVKLRVVERKLNGHLYPESGTLRLASSNEVIGKVKNVTITVIEDNS